MARDLAEQERAFVNSLGEDTGRDLAGWMSAIAASGHARRNDIIDWLRHQGFTFANASWLERIHHNGGHLIYGEAAGGNVAQPVSPPASATDATQPAAPAHPPEKVAATEPPPTPASAIPATEPTRLAPANDDDIAALLLAAKGLRPLAELVLREMDALVPTLVRAATPPLIIIASPMPFAALLPAPKEVRLFADFGPDGRDRARKADTGRIATPFPDVLVLNDARQIDDRFRELVAAAYTRSLT